MGKLTVTILLTSMMSFWAQPGAAFWRYPELDNDRAEYSVEEPSFRGDPWSYARRDVQISASQCDMVTQPELYVIAAENANNEEFLYRDGRMDQVSQHCASCHDGAFGKDSMVSVRSQATRGERQFIASGKENHPIGMLYAAAVADRPADFKPAQTLPATVRLIQGRVSCISCHDPRSRHPAHTAVSDFRSGLCHSCHIK